MISRIQITRWIQNYHRINKKTPTKKEIKNFCSPTTVLRRFGSWNKAIFTAGLKPNNILNKERIKTRCPNCKTKIEKLQSELNRSKSDKLFCSTRCGTIFNNKNRPKKNQNLKSVNVVKTKYNVKVFIVNYVIHNL